MVRPLDRPNRHSPTWPSCRRPLTCWFARLGTVQAGRPWGPGAAIRRAVAWPGSPPMLRWGALLCEGFRPTHMTCHIGQATPTIAYLACAGTVPAAFGRLPLCGPRSGLGCQAGMVLPRLLLNGCAPPCLPNTRHATSPGRPVATHHVMFERWASPAVPRRVIAGTPHAHRRPKVCRLSMESNGLSLTQGRCAQP